MQVPRLEKIVLNMGLGEAIQNPKLLDAGVDQLCGYLWAKASDYQGAQIYRCIQVADGDVDWGESDPTQRPYV